MQHDLLCPMTVNEALAVHQVHCSWRHCNGSLQTCQSFKFTSIYTSALFDGFLSNTPFSLLGTDLCGVSSFERQVLQVLTVSFLEVRFRDVSSLQKGSVGRTSLLPPGWIHHDQFNRHFNPGLASSTPGHKDIIRHH